MNKTKRIIISAIITFVVVAIAFYVVLTPINPQSIDFWGFVAFAAILFGVCNGLIDYKCNGSKGANKFKTKNKIKKDPFYVVVTVVAPSSPFAKSTGRSRRDALITSVPFLPR